MKMESSQVIKSLFFIAAGGGCIAVLFFIFAWSTFEVNDIDRASITYRLAAPQSLQSVELIGECRQPKVHWKGRDGESSPFSSLTYGSSLSADEILHFYRTAFKKNLCEPDYSATAPASKNLLSMSCKNSDFSSVKVFVDKVAACREVSIDFIENY